LELLNRIKPDFGNDLLFFGYYGFMCKKCKSYDRLRKEKRYLAAAKKKLVKDMDISRLLKTTKNLKTIVGSLLMSKNSSLWVTFHHKHLINTSDSNSETDIDSLGFMEVFTRLVKSYSKEKAKPGSHEYKLMRAVIPPKYRYEEKHNLNSFVEAEEKLFRETQHTVLNSSS